MSLRTIAAAWATPIRRWVDTQAPEVFDGDPDSIDWRRALPFVLLHIGCFGVIWTGTSPIALTMAAGLYALRMFALTGFYHRYFSHRAFRTSRGMQFLFAVLGASCAQRGPLWWAAHHRHHHCNSDNEKDLHSPGRHGFWWSHMGWFLTKRAFKTDLTRVPDFYQFSELRWLNRFDVVVPGVLAVLCYGLGAMLNHFYPDLGTSGLQMLVWGFFISTVLLFHATVTINSLAHQYGVQRYATGDDSRNNFWLALLTFGEGWHNNHHFYPGSVRQGFRAHEVDITWYGLRLLAALGLIWDLKSPPPWVLTSAKE